MQLTINLPRQIDASEFDAKMCLASKLYEDGRASLGHAAEVAGISKRAFIELLGKYHVSLFQETADETQRDIENAEKLFGR